MTDNNQDRSQEEGQSGIDRETEQRNRENETGQNQSQRPDQASGQAGSGSGGQSDSFSGGQSGGGSNDQGSSAFGQQGQSAGGETNLADKDQTGGQSSTGQASSSDSGFVGSGNDNSSDYLTKGEENQDFAPEGQGAQETSQGRSDVETGQSQDTSNPEDGSGNN